MKVKICREERAASGDPRDVTIDRRIRVAFDASNEQAERTLSPHVGTRKMVTYA